MTASRRRWVAGAVGLGVLGAATLLVRAAVVGAPAPVAAGRRAPPFVALTVDAVPVRRSLEDYAGHPTLLNVWATWCDPCRDEMPGLDRLYRDYAARGLRVVAVSIDDPDSDQLIRDFVREHALTFDVLHDSHADIMSTYLVRGVPETFLINRKGEIAGTRFGADWSTAESRALVDSLLLRAAP